MVSNSSFEEVERGVNGKSQGILSCLHFLVFYMYIDQHCAGRQGSRLDKLIIYIILFDRNIS